jgi:putative sterol carrier protein
MLTFDQLTADTPSNDFADLVAGSSDEDVAAAMSDPELRAKVLAAIFGQMPSRLRADRARGLDAVVHWVVTGKDEARDEWEVVIRDEACTVGEGFTEPKATVRFEVPDVQFLRMIAGQTTGMKLMIGRKLRVRGDMMFAPRIEGLFKTDPAAA